MNSIQQRRNTMCTLTPLLLPENCLNVDNGIKSAPPTPATPSIVVTEHFFPKLNQKEENKVEPEPKIEPKPLDEEETTPIRNKVSWTKQAR